MSVESKMTAIADAIREKTGKQEALSLDIMAADISGLHTFYPPSSECLTPQEIYRNTRPADWLPLPVPGDNEMFFLGHLVEGVDNQFLIRLNFTGTCSVEFGNLVNGVFTAKETVTPVRNTTLYHFLNFNDYGDETADGYRQYLVRITGDRIMGVYGSTNVNDSAACIVDFVCGIKLDGFSVNNGQANVNQNKTFAKTRYIRFVGNGNPGEISCGFMFATFLMAIECQSPNTCTSQYHFFAFMNCRNLLAVSPNVFPEVVCSYESMFRNSNLPCLPQTGGKANNAYRMFYTSGLMHYDGACLDTSDVARFDYMFSSSYGLQSVVNLDISSMTSCVSMFSECSSLQKLTFAGSVTPGGVTIDLTAASLSHTALVNMFASLPVATAPAVINITNNPGASALTQTEIAVATAKNWTVTM